MSPIKFLHVYPSLGQIEVFIHIDLMTHILFGVNASGRDENNQDLIEQLF